MSSTRATESAWHYQDGAQAAGPVSAEVIRQKIQQGTIRRGTLVWTDGMVNWAAVESTPFANESGSTLNNPYAATSAAILSPMQPSADVITGPVSDTPAWVIATAPLWLTLLTLLPGTSFVSMGIYIGLAVWDRETIKKTGRTPSNAYWWAIILGAFGAPIYLYLRSRRLDGKMSYFVTSIVSLVVFFLIIAGIAMAARG